MESICCQKEETNEKQGPCAVETKFRNRNKNYVELCLLMDASSGGTSMTLFIWNAFKVDGRRRTPECCRDQGFDLLTSWVHCQWQRAS